jgi:hypothetical protein
MVATVNASTSAGVVITPDNSGVLAFQSSSATALTIDASQNVGIGATTPADALNIGVGKKFRATHSASVYQQIFSSSSGNFINAYGDSLQLTADSGAMYFSTTAAQPMVFQTTNTERMRIDSSGQVLLGTTSASQSTGSGIKFLDAGGNYSPTAIIIANAADNNTPWMLKNVNATYNGTRWYVKMDGGIGNFSGNNVNLSDERTKTNIELSGNYLSKICAIPVKLFNYKDEQENEQRTLGVIAQDVETHAPEFVNNEGFGDMPENGIPLKSIYTTDMMFALMKSIQELKAINDTLTARIVALENR